MKNSLFNTRLQPAALLKMLLLVILLGLSWLWSPSRAIWDRVDIGVFSLLNHPMAGHLFLAKGWAVLNMRPIDLVSGLLLFSLLLRTNWTVKAEEVKTALIGFVCLLLWMLLLRIMLVHILSTDFSWSRASPSLTLPDAVRLSELFPDWRQKYFMKDASPVSFPGDHTSVLLIWAMFVTRFTSGYKPCLAWGLAILLSLPRLTAGAHWFTDDLVGGLGIAMVAYASAMYTPLLSIYTRIAEERLTPLLRLFKHLPFLRNMSFFQYLK